MTPRIRARTRPTPSLALASAPTVALAAALVTAAPLSSAVADAADADDAPPESSVMPAADDLILESGELRASDVSAYLEAYRREAARMHIEYDGERSPLSFVAVEGDRLILEYGRGVIVSEPGGSEGSTGPVTLLEGDVARVADGEDAFLESVTRRLRAEKGFRLAETDGGDERFAGEVVDERSGETIAVTGASNDALFVGGRVFFSLDGEDLHLRGLFGTRAYLELEELLEREPGIRRLVFDDVQGSVNDAINLHIGRLVREAGLATHVPADGSTVSGGSDLFVAGHPRTVEPGGVIGVHAGCCVDGRGVDEVPRSHPVHTKFVAYHEEMLGERGEAFHFFTVEAAPFDGMHHMSREEMLRYGVVTR